jgi:nucleoside-diphosphate-sugar epimerase
MSGSTVFVTGATGFIGAHVALAALKAGHNVKLSVRREGQIESLRRALETFADKLEFAVVPDYTTTGAFDEALKGTDYVIHVASPLPKPNEDLLTPALKGTTSILESASKTSTIKRIVITASVASLIPLGKGGDGLTVKGNMLQSPCQISLEALLIES